MNLFCFWDIFNKSNNKAIIDRNAEISFTEYLLEDFEIMRWKLCMKNILMVTQINKFQIKL